MSYDLFVFDPSAAPREPKAFSEWVSSVMETDGSFDRADPATCSAPLQAWYRDMIRVFPSMNGPDAPRGFSEFLAGSRITGYDCAPRAIQMDFRWNVARRAYQRTVALAQMHGIGFFDMSGEGEVWGPTSSAGYEVWFVAQ